MERLIESFSIVRDHCDSEIEKFSSKYVKLNIQLGCYVVCIHFRKLMVPVKIRN
jgi:hypothetical protein